MIHDVGDTALWVAQFRALESERKDALFHDPYARSLAGERGRALVASMPPGPLAWSLAVKTRVFDELILETVEANKLSLVLNLGAGLDARPFRLPLPKTLTWIEVDTSQVLEHKAAILPIDQAKCRLMRAACDLADASQRARLMESLGVVGDALVVTEGVLPYLSEAAVQALADELFARQALRFWVLDLMSPGQLARQRRTWGKQLGQAAEMRFGPNLGLDFFARSGWQSHRRLSLITEAKRLGREMHLAPLVRFFASMMSSVRRELEQAVTLAVLARSRHRDATASACGSRDLFPESRC